MGTYEKAVRELVAPFTGAWIEIMLIILRVCKIASLPSRERGLKLWRVAIQDCRQGSLPSRERGLKSPWAASWRKASGRSLHGSVD